MFWLLWTVLQILGIHGFVFTTIRIISFGINKVNKVYFDDYDHALIAWAGFLCSECGYYLPLCL